MKKESIDRTDYPGTETIVCCDGGYKKSGALQHQIGKGAAGFIKISNHFKVSRGRIVEHYHPDWTEEKHGDLVAELMAAAYGLEEVKKDSTIDLYSDHVAVVSFINSGKLITGAAQSPQLESIYWRLKQAIMKHHYVAAHHPKDVKNPVIYSLLEECHDLAAGKIGSRSTARKSTRPDRNGSRPPQYGGNRKHRGRKPANNKTKTGFKPPTLE